MLLFGLLAAFLIVVLTAAISLYVQQRRVTSPNGRDLRQKAVDPVKVTKTEKTNTKSVTSKAPKGSKGGKGKTQHFTHPRLLKSLGGHNDFINDFGVSKKELKLSTVSVDRTMRIWNDPLEPNSKYSVVKVESLGKEGGVNYPDEPLKVCINGDASTAFCILDQADQLKSYVVDSLKMVHGYQKPLSQKGTIRYFNVFGDGEGIVSVSDSMEMKIWSPQGETLATVNTHQGKLNDVSVSANGRFIATAGFTSDVQIYEIVKTRGTNAFSACKKVMNLRGHKAAVYSVGFAGDNKTVATVSRDGTMKIWNIDVRYHVNEDPKLLLSFSPEGPQKLERVLLSPDSKVAVISEGSSLWYYRLSDGKLLEFIDHTTPNPSPSYAGNGRIIKMDFLGGKPYLVTLCEVDKMVRIWSTPDPTASA